MHRGHDTLTYIRKEDYYFLSVLHWNQKTSLMGKFLELKTIPLVLPMDKFKESFD